METVLWIVLAVTVVTYLAIWDLDTGVKTLREELNELERKIDELKDKLGDELELDE